MEFRYHDFDAYYPNGDFEDHKVSLKAGTNSKVERPSRYVL